MRCIKRRKGFTLVELAVVLAVIAIIIAIVAPNFDKIVGNSQNSSSLTQAKALYDEYVIDNSKSGTIDDELYIEVDGGYILYLNGKAYKLEDGSYFVDKIYVNDDLLDSNGKYVESKFKTHESIKEEFLKDFNKFAKDNGNVKVDNFDGFVASPVADEFLSLDTNSEKYDKWEWLFNEVNSVTAEKIRDFFTDQNVVFENYYQLIPREHFFSSDYFELPVYEINFDLSGGEWNEETPVTSFEEGDVIILSEPIKNGYRFEGWHDNVDGTGDIYTSTSQIYNYCLEHEENSITLYPVWEPINYLIEYDITTIKTGEVVTGIKIGKKIITVDIIINDLLNDYNSYSSTSHTTSSFYNLAYNTEVVKIAEFWIENPNTRVKWRWLAEFLAENINTTNSSFTTKNKKSWATVFNYTDYNDYHKGYDGVTGHSIYGLELEMKGLVGKNKKFTTSGVGVYSTDYSNLTLQSKLLLAYQDYLKIDSNSLEVVYNIESDNIILPTVSIQGFDGWYTTSTFEEDSKITTITQGSTGNLTLYPKWKGFIGLHKSSISITNFYDYDNYTDAKVTNKIFLCNPDMIPRNNLKFQHKILLQYDPIKNAYLVIAESPAYPNVGINSVTLPAGTSWTHAISDSTENSPLLSYTKVGDYIVLPNDLSVGMGQFIAYVYGADQWA